MLGLEGWLERNIQAWQGRSEFKDPNFPPRPRGRFGLWLQVLYLAAFTDTNGMVVCSGDGIFSCTIDARVLDCDTLRYSVTEQAARNVSALAYSQPAFEQSPKLLLESISRVIGKLGSLPPIVSIELLVGLRTTAMRP
ncbi:uncharacterized protein BO72DRAFT_231172 [Aspergillus fijiensis CBS 313.89]|uniref:Uncharacterized protein n=1 Tax=Aspergillus fijiensis CBS 313.89 TaxID=1448319 RepID=A0A8G1RH09_9EURO|nr:uncharacterized protein BO72DRAFT_231172 [Aspergillus fijiensis CBS 313.89]RAK73702.1 hypothetical protein BO72DRAFT_231172 [Aspergillus fijiensis CBS 313.89]